MRFSQTTLILLLIVPALTHAQQELKGVINEEQTGRHLQGAVVYIPDLRVGTLSDSLGTYHLRNIPAGSYLVETSLVGYGRQLRMLNIQGVVQADYTLAPSPSGLSEVTVTGVSSATDPLNSPFSVVSVGSKDLQENTSTNVIDAISKVPGVSAMTSGQSISKPVIRGLGYNRVLTINDGVEQLDQVWFDEFGIEADPDAVGRYEILKGPASLAYGSDAIAGVINLIPEQPLPEGQSKGNLLFNYQTNNGLINNMAWLAGTKNGIAWSARIDNIMAHAYRNPYDGYVLNSAFSNFNTDGTLGLHRKWGYTQLHASYFEMHTGIVDGTRDSATGKMERQVSYPDLNSGEPTYELPTRQEERSYTPFTINQRIRHTKLVWDNSIAAGSGRITGLFSWQKNQRQESNDPTIPNTPNIYYSSNGYTYDLRYVSPQTNDFSYSTGINGAWQSSKSLGTLMLIPNYHFFQVGGFVIVNQKLGKVNLSGGLRYDTRTFHGTDHWVDSTTQAPVASDAPDAFHEFQGFRSQFNGISFNAGATYDLGKNFYIKGNIARGWRAPNVAECGANGVHDGTVVYEIGDPSLRPETSLEEDLAFGLHSKDIQFELDLFNNNIHDFIYAKGLQSVSGGDSINNSLNAAGLGEAPVYKFTQGKAQLYGGELSVTVHPSTIPWLSLNSGVSMVYGSLLHTPDSVKYLPFVPPARITAEVRFLIPPPGHRLKNLYIKAGILDCFRQNKVYLQSAIYNGLNTAVTPYEYAASRAATNGYALFNAGFGGDILSNGRKAVQVFVQCDNLFNTGYMDYMSRFKYAPVNYTTGRVGVFNMGRNVSVRILVPLGLD